MQLPTTQRAYTLRLRGTSKDDQSWRHWLWKTHEAVNLGARVFGDWLLTLRGGLDHRLADEPTPTDDAIEKEWERLKKEAKEQAENKKSVKLPSREVAVRICDEQRLARLRDKRIVLALSWLSVESELGAPQAFAVDRDTDGKQQPVAALKQILQARGLNADEIADWVRDCSETLEAKIRTGDHISDRAIWINRSVAFDAATTLFGERLSQDHLWDLLGRFWNLKSYFEMPASQQVNGADAEKDAKKEKDRELVKEANGWLRDRFGTGKGSDFSAKALEYRAFAAWCRGMHAEASPDQLITDLKRQMRLDELPARLAATPGESNAVQLAYAEIVEELRSGMLPTRTDWETLAALADERADEKAKKVGKKHKAEWASLLLAEVERATGFNYIDPESGNQRGWEYAVILDHAARRVCMAHSWVKRAEVTRRGFVKSLKRMTELTEKLPNVKDWLDDFCERRSGTTGAAEAYRIRPGAVEGWKEIVAAWSRSKCKTEQDRIDAAHELQDSDDIEKFGDIQLFEALAAEEAKCVWHDADGEPSEKPLLDYVAATDAAFKMREYKVPAYRHPDELRHPVFCDFGESRWNISFAVHRYRSQIDSAKSAVTRADVAVQKATQKLGKAKTEEKRQAAQLELELAHQKLKKARAELNWLQTRNGLRIKLWNGETVAEQELSWASKRLRRDLSLSGRAGDVSPPVDGAMDSVDRTPTSGRLDGSDVGVRTTETTASIVVTRGDRYGRAVTNAREDQAVEVAGLFGLKEWNGRLQAPREELDAIADVRDGIKAKRLSDAERHARVEKMQRRLHWFITFSAKLTPRGEYVTFAKKHEKAFPNQRIVQTKREEGQEKIAIAPANKRDEWRGLAYPFWHPLNGSDRKGRARHVLSRLVAGLRILSVDLGHRYAAACAVWETVTTNTVEDECRKAGVPVPKPADLFVFVPKAQHGHTLFRRIGADKIGDKEHPAPWARLDRQFLVKLQGEDQPARWSNDEEKNLVKSLESDLGYVRDEDNQLSGDDWRVDRLMSEALRTARLALRRHGDYARIADGLIATDRPGMGKNAREKLDGAKLVEHLQDVLVRWHSLATSKRWEDDFAAREWEKHIPEFKLTKQADDLTGPQRKALTKKLREQLEPVAKRLSASDRMTMHIAWATEWRTEDAAWPVRLKQLRKRIAPRGKKSDKSIRHTGGLSLTRVTTFTELYQLQKAFYARLQLDPTTGRIVEPRAIAGRRFAQRLLDQRDAMRENRVKQLASRIAEAALGIGIEKSRGETGRQLKRPRERLDRTLGQRFAPCHAVVIENLTRYRPDELQTRRENRQLMSWSSARVKKYLSEACQLHGLHLREVQPSYTSRQDFRTGAPGVRCVDVTVAEFPKRFGRELKRARESGGSNAFDRYLIDLANKHLQADDKTPKDNHDKLVLRIPKRGGEIFVSATEVPSSKPRKGPPGVQADLNAAGNIGLKALLDPDWEGAWWYVPTVLDKDGYRMPQPDKTKGTPVFESWKEMGRSENGYVQSGSRETRDEEDSAKKKSKKGRTKDVVNLWRDVSSRPLASGEWRVYSAYEFDVRERVIRQLRKAAELDSDKPVDEENPF